MIFKHSSAVKTVNGKSGWRFRKCLFSVTNASAPTHSAKAAMRASASFSPLTSYFTPISKGTRKSSSMLVKRLMNLKKLWNSFGVKFALTSSTIVRHIAIECKGKLSISRIMSVSELCFLNIPSPNMYSLASSTNRKLFLPEFLPGRSQMFHYLFFAHSGKRGRSFGYTFSKLFPKFFCLCCLIFHYASPCLKITMKIGSCQCKLARLFQGF